MIYHKIWLVVKPTVGIPVFLGAVAVSSFAVHLALATKVDWLSAYWNNTPKVKADGGASAAAPPAAPAAKPAEKGK